MMAGRVSALAARIEEASHAFVAPIESSFWAEHGISGEEAEQGALAMMLHLGVLSEEEGDDVRRMWRKRERAERRRAVLRTRRYLASLTPERRYIEEMLRESMGLMGRSIRASVVDAIFAPSQKFPWYGKGGDS